MTTGEGQNDILSLRRRVAFVGAGLSRTANKGFGRDPALVLRRQAGKPVPTEDVATTQIRKEVI